MNKVVVPRPATEPTTPNSILWKGKTVKHLILPVALVIIAGTFFSHAATIASAEASLETVFVGYGNTAIDAEDSAHAQARAYYAQFWLTYRVLDKQEGYDQHKQQYYCRLTTEAKQFP